MVAISKTVGKELKSSARWMNNTVIKIKIEMVIDMPRVTSSSQVGIGRIKIARIATTPSAKAISPFARTDFICANSAPPSRLPAGVFSSPLPGSGT